MAPAVPVLEPRPTLAIVGSNERFAVRRAFCIGRNYAAHALEMGGNPDRDPPFFFMKLAEAIQPVESSAEAPLAYPAMTDNYHHEVELVVALATGGKDIAEKDALSHVYGFAAGLDMTRRDRQDEAKKLSRPWEVAKSADASGPVGPITPASDAFSLKGTIRLTVDGKVRQDSTLAAMIWSVPEQIAILSRYFELMPGDLIFTGTPEGVAAVTRGQAMTVEIDGVTPITVRLV
jgi:fumarylpyruvate hydrolase